jgi:hypothetical protein
LKLLKDRPDDFSNRLGICTLVSAIAYMNILSLPKIDGILTRLSHNLTVTAEPLSQNSNISLTLLMVGDAIEDNL